MNLPEFNINSTFDFPAKLNLLTLYDLRIKLELNCTWLISLKGMFNGFYKPHLTIILSGKIEIVLIAMALYSAIKKPAQEELKPLWY